MSNNSQSKSLAAMFLLGAFLTGGALGFVADRTIAAKKPAPRSYTSSELVRDLDLSDEQRAAFDSIFVWRNNADREASKPVKHLYVANRDSARVLMMQRLTPEQQAKFKALLEEQKLKAEKRRAEQSSR
jgi:Spy/CpxP family protein refolding chaperone